MYSLIPRGIRRFFFNDDVSAKPVNDTINVFLTATLPLNFAYIMTRFNWQFSTDTIADWQKTVVCRMLSHIPGQPNGVSEHVAVLMQDFFPPGSTNQLVVGAEAAAAVPKPFTGPFWSTHGGGIDFRVQMSNTTAAVGGTGFLISHLEFLEYDLTQAQRYYVNTPLPTIAR